ncbi:hypothetical protein ATCC90586_011309 [Pythium insidiosum]|nr:hypothetical protein ATCC90586_011309 [Pythium insidiosum]
MLTKGRTGAASQRHPTASQDVHPTPGCSDNSLDAGAASNTIDAQTTKYACSGSVANGSIASDVAKGKSGWTLNVHRMQAVWLELLESSARQKASQPISNISELGQSFPTANSRHYGRQYAHAHHRDVSERSKPEPA